MTRTEETCKGISLIGEIMVRDKVTQKDLLGAIVSVLCDISKSLAIITDKLTEAENIELKEEIARLKDEASWDKHPEPGH